MDKPISKSAEERRQVDMIKDGWIFYKDGTKKKIEDDAHPVAEILEK